MGAIDFLLNLAGLLLWLSWRSMRFDPLMKSAPVTLLGTLKRAEPRRLKGWQLVVALATLVGLRGVFYLFIGAPADWTPKLNLELVVLAFRSDQLSSVLVFSLLSFVRVMVVFYFWLLVLAVINRSSVETAPIQRTVRLHLGKTARWPWPVQLLLPFIFVIVLWIACSPILVKLGVVAPPHSKTHLIEQGLLVDLGLLLSLKYILPAFLLLHLVASYVYLGSNPLWDFITTTAVNMTAPLRRLPFRFARLDFTPVVGVILILFLFQWLPNLILSRMAAYRMSIWPL
jgi:uncharacterized protein YggT (Ycf19 family)